MGERLTIHLLDEDSRLRATLALFLTGANYHVEIYDSGHEFLARLPRHGLLLLDHGLSDIGASDILDHLAAAHRPLPVVMMSDCGDLCAAVAAMKAGAYDFLVKPISYDGLLATLDEAWQRFTDTNAQLYRTAQARVRLTDLTPREKQVLDQLAGGNSNKQIARTLEISPRTVELHRAHVMRKLNAGHVSDALRIYFEGGL